MLKLDELYEIRKVVVGENTYHNHVVPFTLKSGEKYLLDFSSPAKNAMRADGRDHRGTVGPMLAIEIDRAVDYAAHVESIAHLRNARRFSTRGGYIVKEDPLYN